MYHIFINSLPWERHLDLILPLLKGAEKPWNIEFTVFSMAENLKNAAIVLTSPPEDTGDFRGSYQIRPNETLEAFEAKIRKDLDKEKDVLARVVIHVQQKQFMEKIIPFLQTVRCGHTLLIKGHLSDVDKNSLLTMLLAKECPDNLRLSFEASSFVAKKQKEQMQKILVLHAMLLKSKEDNTPLTVPGLLSIILDYTFDFVEEPKPAPCHCDHNIRSRANISRLGRLAATTGVFSAFAAVASIYTLDDPDDPYSSGPENA
jgi:hypothetical protein